jgi:solute:Na+ symporter, SSS family
LLLFCIAIYLLVTVLIGLFTSRYVKSSEDFILAGRRLPLMLSASALFATWFGSETILGASSEFVEHGLYGVIEDPFGAALCLFLVGVFFARPIYRMNLTTFGDFYRQKFSPNTELVAGFFMVPSYFGWVAAQLVALGIILNVVSGIAIIHGIVLSAVVVALYTYIGGMWAVTVADFVQTIIIIGGLLFLSVYMLEEAGGIEKVYNQTPEGFFTFLPEPDFNHVLKYFAAWITIGLGSIPQQDVFQRVMASRSNKVAVRASFISSGMYLTIGMLPLLIGLCAKVAFPTLTMSDGQALLPQVVLRHTHLLVQVLFFGALLSAIMSTTSGAILAPAAILSENLIKPLAKGKIKTRHHLLLVRVCVIGIAMVAAGLACMQTNIYELVGESSALSLVSLFVPMVAGIYWKKASSLGAIMAMVAGLGTWLLMEKMLETNFPAIVGGLLISIIAMVIGTCVKPKKENRAKKEDWECGDKFEQERCLVLQE